MKDPEEVIDQLSHPEALSILRALANENEGLAQRIAGIARDSLSEVDPGEVADALCAELDALEVEEVWDRAGRTRYGYVEPYEAAYDMVQEVLEPFLDDLRKSQKLGLSKAVTQLCTGLLKGLYRFERESKSEFKDWAADAPVSFAAEVVKAWRAGGPNHASVAALELFIAEELDGWAKNIHLETH